MEIMSLYIEVLEIFYELKICYLDAAKQPVVSIARYCSTLGYKL